MQTDEELVLFYLRLLSPAWNEAFFNLIRQAGVKTTGYITEMMEEVRNSMPAEWVAAMRAYDHFSTYILQNKQTHARSVKTLQPINLMTISQIVQATVILSMSRDSNRRLQRRFPRGFSNNSVYFGDLAPSGRGTKSGVSSCPFTPGRILSDPKWDPIKERALRTVIRNQILPSLEQEVAVDKVTLVKLAERRQESKAVIQAISQYVTHLQRLAWHGNDQALVDGLIFFLAVKECASPASDAWEHLVQRYKGDREGLQDRVFEGKRRTIQDYVAIQFLRNYIGPKAYASKSFPGTYQQYNETIAAFVLRATEGRRRRSTTYQD